MTARLRPVRHVHSSWPAPYAGVVAAALFAFAVVAFMTMIVQLMW